MNLFPKTRTVPPRTTTPATTTICLNAPNAQKAALLRVMGHWKLPTCRALIQGILTCAQLLAKSPVLAFRVQMLFVRLKGIVLNFLA